MEVGVEVEGGREGREVRRKGSGVEVGGGCGCVGREGGVGLEVEGGLRVSEGVANERKSTTGPNLDHSAVVLAN